MTDKELLWKAYLAGFKRSGEGWNGGYPWRIGEERRESMKEDLRHGVGDTDGFEDWYDKEADSEDDA